MEHAIGIVERKYAWYRTISIPIAYWSNYVFFYLCGIDSFVESKVEKLESKYFFTRGLIRHEGMVTG